LKFTGSNIPLRNGEGALRDGRGHADPAERHLDFRNFVLFWVESLAFYEYDKHK